MVLMIVGLLALLGLCAGSFVNALVWRIHEQDYEHAKKRPKKVYLKKLSIISGRSMCPDCKHELKAIDLLPVVSWLSVAGKCRYCRKPISVQYPLIEIFTALLFVGSYVWWPEPLTGWLVAGFAAWLALITGYVALLLYDLKWYLLPNRIVFPLVPLAGVLALQSVITASNPGSVLIDMALAVGVGGGIFYVLFQVSAGKWIGGGDVKLGWVVGLALGTPDKALLFIFLAAILGTCASLPLLLEQKLKPTSVIPFGPFLIISAIIVQLFGAAIITWYRTSILGLAA